MAQRLLTHPHADQSLCFRALTGNSKAIAAAASKWVFGIQSEFARPAPVTVDTFHIHLKKEGPFRVHYNVLGEINLRTRSSDTFLFHLVK